MAWLRLSLDCSKQGAEIIQDLLERFGAISVSLEAISDELIVDHNSREQQLWEQTRVIALLDEATDLDILTGCLRNAVGNDAISNHSIKLLQDQDWVSNYHLQFGPRIFGEKLCICPGWSDPPASIKHILMMDPGLAFGTGSHPTTSLCLNWLVEQDLKDRTVIDYGCGSGVLALSALKLGAKFTWAVDIDPVAVMATRDNAVRNDLSEKIRVGLPDEDDNIPRSSLLIANVLLNPLMELAGKFSRMLIPGADIVLSGILVTQVDDCLAAYNRWFTMNQPVFSEEWGMLTGKFNNNL